MMEGYKVFDPDWKCRGFQYEVGKTYQEDIKPSCCERGFHFCKNLIDCFNYYRFDPNNKVAKVIALGEIDQEEFDSKCCTNKIQIVEEISWEDVLRMVNIGKRNTGIANTGNRNTGDFNTGNFNTGNRNTGNYNTGNYNTGDCNTGDWNTGDRNIGDCNSGNCNSGNRNTGNRNIGDCNTGNCNTGSYNTGNRNTGDFNTGDYNSGNCNSGDYNSGDWNSGDWNSGDWNKTNFSNGCFNTEEQKIFLFNKPSDWTYRDWLNSDARCLLNQMPKNVVEWVFSYNMTDEEKEQYPEYKVVGGYLKILDESDCVQKWWDNLSENEKDIVKAIPNFDAEIFCECTGIRV